MVVVVVVAALQRSVCAARDKAAWGSPRPRPRSFPCGRWWCRRRWRRRCCQRARPPSSCASGRSSSAEEKEKKEEAPEKEEAVTAAVAAAAVAAAAAAAVVVFGVHDEDGAGRPEKAQQARASESTAPTTR